jgi:hypothetical protein
MPKRIPAWLTKQIREHPLMTNVIVLLMIVVPGYVAFERQQAATEREQVCGEHFASALYASTVPFRLAQSELNAADALIWIDTQVILTQKAVPSDYKALRSAVKDRNTLWAHLVADQRKHPFPPPPDSFC